MITKFTSDFASLQVYVKILLQCLSLIKPVYVFRLDKSQFTPDFVSILI